MGNLLSSFCLTFPAKVISPNFQFLMPFDQCDCIYFIENGCFRMYLISPNGNELTLNIYSDNSIIPLFNLTDNEIKNNQFYFESMSKCLVRTIPLCELQSFLKSHWECNREIFTKVVEDVNMLTTRITHFIFDNALSKTILALQFYAKHFGNITNNEVYFSVPFSHRELGCFVGLSRETITRELNKLCLMNVIKIEYKKIKITDFKQLNILQTKNE